MDTRNCDNPVLWTDEEVTNHESRVPVHLWHDTSYHRSLMSTRCHTGVTAVSYRCRTGVMSAQNDQESSEPLHEAGMESNRTDRPDLRNPGGIILSQAGQSGPIRADCNFASNASRAQSPGCARWGNIPKPLRTHGRPCELFMKSSFPPSVQPEAVCVFDRMAFPIAEKRKVGRAMTQSHRIHFTTDTKRKKVPVNVKRTTSFAQRYAFFMI